MPALDLELNSKTPPPFRLAIAGRLLVFLGFGVAAGLAACTVQEKSGWLWCIGAFLPLGPALGMLLGAHLGWPEIHPTWLRGSIATTLLALSFPWAVAGCWLGIFAANDIFKTATVDADIKWGVTVAAAFTVILVYIALGIATGDWSAQVAGELALAAVLTLLVARVAADWEQFALFPTGMGLMSAVMGWYLLRPGWRKSWRAD